MRRSNKDILLGLVGTLSDEECKAVYYLIKDIQEPLVEWLEFGKVKLTRNQYSKLVWMWGKDKTDKCVDILNEWITRKNITKRFSHYHNILGWVEDRYNVLYPSKNKKMKSSEYIDTATKAKKYIQWIPKELRATDREVKYLVERFGTEILKD